jgi:hypothetical protein
MPPENYQKTINEITELALNQGLSPAVVIATLEMTKHSVMHALMAKANAPRIVRPTFIPPEGAGR